MKFRKKPVEVEAVQWTGQNTSQMKHFMMPSELQLDHWNGNGRIRIRTLEGVMWASPNDWIIRGVKGELYPCKPDIFEATYEQA